MKGTLVNRREPDMRAMAGRHKKKTEKRTVVVCTLWTRCCSFFSWSSMSKRPASPTLEQPAAKRSRTLSRKRRKRRHRKSPVVSDPTPAPTASSSLRSTIKPDPLPSSFSDKGKGKEDAVAGPSTLPQVDPIVLMTEELQAKTLVCPPCLTHHIYLYICSFFKPNKKCLPKPNSL
jgi:hypothetical protein